MSVVLGVLTAVAILAWPFVVVGIGIAIPLIIFRARDRRAGSDE